MFPDARILDVDLTNQRIGTKILPGEIYRLYPGGSALGVYLLLQEMEPGVDPLSPNNMLVFSVSPLTGLPISGISRVTVTTKSPLTGTIGDSQAGGFFPVHLKANGWDAVLFRGKAEKPVYLYIDGEKAELRPAEHLWGKVTGEAEKLIKEEIGDDRLEVAQIGPAGEKLVKYACIINMSNRANGRNGTGAVMGSKNLKAVAVKKAKPIAPFDKEGFSTLTKNILERLKNNPTVDGLGKYGTDGDLLGFHEAGFLPTKNWTTGWFPEGAEKITGTTMYDTILVERDTCYGCAVRCKRVVEVPGKVDPFYGGPEYETCATFGSYCGITSLETVALANQLCNMYGLDTISCGATIAFAMECYEKGLINKNDTGGLELNFGNSEVVPKLVEMIAKRKGFGDLLAEGSYRAAQKIGGDALSMTMSVKGQELPAHMPQFKPAVGLIYAVNPFGADHQSSEHDSFLTMPPDSQERRWIAQIGTWKGYEDTFELDDEKVRFAFDSQCYFSILDTLCLCQFVWGPCWELYGPSDLIDLCKYGIGWETSLFELMRVGERRINMMRYFNAREGFTKADDYLPERMFTPLPDGPSKGVCVDKEKFATALNTYYQFAGWDPETGNPTEATLRKLSLGWLLDK
ncbi:aldehyde ferredoxin oxidoreductase family protein [Zhaonella formicivorans]|uniref:aldehyde ferredoxin oxidoreductase family protein n=1 Tax=Zhaonella formicivorans TaxID=2528593 RepID=UPI0010DBAF63|nr:aldehyde ferredoxin oxidoreductase family protein [Zhaonella formicivorans]